MVRDGTHVARSSAPSSSTPASSSSCASASSLKKNHREWRRRGGQKNFSLETKDSSAPSSSLPCGFLSLWFLRFARGSCIRSATPSRYACQARALPRTSRRPGATSLPSGACAEHHRPRVLAMSALDCGMSPVELHRLRRAPVVFHEGMLADRLLADAAHVLAGELVAFVHAPLDEDGQRARPQPARAPRTSAPSGTPGTRRAAACSGAGAVGEVARVEPQPRHHPRKEQGAPSLPDRPPVCSS